MMLLLMGALAALAVTPVTPAAPASEAQVSALLDNIGAKYKGVGTLKASFTQVSGSPLYGIDKSTGTLLLERPGKMRWEFSDGRQFVSDGSTMWVYTPAEKQVVRLRNFGEQAATADSVLQSMHKLAELYNVQVVRSDAAGYELALTPKAGESQFKKLMLGLDAGYVINRVVLTDAFDTATTLDFTGVTLGGKVAPEAFTFVVPPGVQVVEGS